MVPKVLYAFLFRGFKDWVLTYITAWMIVVFKVYNQ